LVDEFGSGEPYAWLAYVVTDSEGQTYRGDLDATGRGKVSNHFAGPIALTLDQEYQGQERLYIELQSRDSYPLKITELQVRAEQTRYLNDNATSTRENPAQACAGQFFQVEVRDLVKHVTHLPPRVYRHYPPNQGPARLMGEFGKTGVALMPQLHTVLEVRPLRALRALTVYYSAILRAQPVPTGTHGDPELLPLRPEARRGSDTLTGELSRATERGQLVRRCVGQVRGALEG
jgi:hypothetical protein